MKKLLILSLAFSLILVAGCGKKATVKAPVVKQMHSNYLPGMVNPKAPASATAAVRKPGDWQDFSQSLVPEGQNKTSYTFLLKYPGDWSENSTAAAGQPNYLFTLAASSKDASDCSAAGVQFSWQYNSPIRTDQKNALKNLATQTDATLGGAKIISTKNIKVAGREGIERQVQGASESTSTYEVLLIGSTNHLKDGQPGEYASVYTVRSCPGTDKAVFDKIVNSIRIAN